MRTMSNSPLVKYTKLSPNNSGTRKHAIDTITIHCVVGHCSLETLGNVFYPKERKASSNYGVDDNGNVGMYCEEKNRSWCSGGTDKNGNPIRVNGISGADNDQRAITIEVASDTKAPYKVTDKAIAGTIELCADICKRNGIKALLWKGDKSLVGQISKQNMTVHYWFANKSCPGDYLYEKMGYIAAEVNKRLGGTVTPPEPEKPATPAPAPSGEAFKPYTVKVTASELNIRKGPGTNYGIVRSIQDTGVYTIVKESDGKGATKWGYLKSGAGWISLDFCKKR
jgi:hypothetical protein